MNRPDQVSDKTRKKVNGAVEALGYTPNFGARVMAAQRTKTIGAIIPTMENVVFARGIQAFQEEFDADGYTLLVASSSYRQDPEERQIWSLVARRADAVPLIGHERDPEIFEYLKSRNIPALVPWAFDRSLSRPSIGFDNRASMRALTREVLRLGHRNVAMITLDRASHDRVAARGDGVLEALREVGLHERHLADQKIHYNAENSARAFAEVMQARPRPTVVLCANDVLTVGALKEARTLGLHVPEGVSIVGFDDIELAQVTYPELTNVHVPHSEMGRRTARTLIDHLENGTPIRSHEMTADIRHRGYPAAPTEGSGRG